MFLIATIELNPTFIFVSIMAVASLLFWLVSYIDNIKLRYSADGKLETKRITEIKNEYDQKLKQYELELKNKILEITITGNQKSKLDFEKFKKIELDERMKEIILNEKKAAQTELAQWKIEMEGKLREDAANRSIGVKVGLVVEQLLPFSEYFRKFNPRDARFIGSPIDLIVFDGITEGTDKVKIYFVEIKTGNNVLSERQKRVKEAVLSKNIEWYPINAVNFRW